MEVSSPAARTNGPAPAQAAMPQTVRVPTVRYAQSLHAIVDVVSTRMLGLLGVLGSIGVFGFAMYDPNQIRTVTCAVYAAGVLWPLVYLYIRKEG